MKRFWVWMVVGTLLAPGCTVVGAIAGDQLAESNNREALRAEQEHRKGPSTMSVDGTSLELAAIGFVLDSIMVYSIARQVQDGAPTNY